MMLSGISNTKAFLISYRLTMILLSEHYSSGQTYEKTGYDFAKCFCNYIADNELELPHDFNYSVHSMNPVGAKNIRDYMEMMAPEFSLQF